MHPQWRPRWIDKTNPLINDSWEKPTPTPVWLSFTSESCYKTSNLSWLQLKQIRWSEIYTRRIKATLLCLSNMGLTGSKYIAGRFYILYILRSLFLTHYFASFFFFNWILLLKIIKQNWLNSIELVFLESWKNDFLQPGKWANHLNSWLCQRKITGKRSIFQSLFPWTCYGHTASEYFGLELSGKAECRDPRKHTLRPPVFTLFGEDLLGFAFLH